MCVQLLPACPLLGFVLRVEGSLNPSQWDPRANPDANLAAVRVRILRKGAQRPSRCNFAHPVHWMRDVHDIGRELPRLLPARLRFAVHRSLTGLLPRGSISTTIRELGPIIPSIVW